MFATFYNMQDAPQAKLNITLETSIKLKYLHEILKRKQEREGQAIKHKESNWKSKKAKLCEYFAECGWDQHSHC